MESVTDPVYPSGKHSFLVTLHLGSREAIPGPYLSCQEENREHHLLKHLWEIWWLLHCAPKPQSKEAVLQVTEHPFAASALSHVQWLTEPCSGSTGTYAIRI